MSKYLKIMEQDKELFKTSLNDYNFNTKMYLLILILTKTFNANNSSLICNFFTKNFNDNDKNERYKHIKLSKTGKYKVKTEFEEKIIDEKDYILKGLEKDIDNYPFYPLEILLYRNESYQKYEKDGGKGFINQLKIYDSFISYIKFFIQSNIMKQVLKNNSSYEYIEILLRNEKHLDEILDETHFKFLPFYGSKNKFGHTNNDLLISFINSIPELVENAIIEDDYKKIDINNLTNICLLLSIGEKFIASIHEIINHLLNGYLYYLSNKKINYKSFKEGNYSNSEFIFEKLLNDGNGFDYLDFNKVIVLLDGISCQKNFNEFQKSLNNEENVENLNKRIKEGKIKGLLKDFIDIYPINFQYFIDNQINLKIMLKGYSGIGIYMLRDEVDTYGGGVAIKK